MTRNFSIVLAALSIATVARDAHAQVDRRPLHQFSLGVGNSTGGDYVERADYTVELVLTKPYARLAHSAIVGIVAGGTFANGSDLTCRLRPGGGCVPTMPRFGYATPLIGAERLGALGTASVGIGLGIAAGAGEHVHPAYLARVDYSTPSIQRVAVVVSGRILAVSGVSDATLALRSVNIGVRFR